MAINPALLVAAKMLQDYFVDKDTGFPLANGLISLYKDEARSFYKNWYYQTGVPGAYTWVPLDNPLHLSSVGTIQDPNGNDVIPFYYPYEENDENVPEAYYITVYSVDENGFPAVLQFTRENFPYMPGVGPTPGVVTPTLRNYILNNVYWRNIGSLTATTVLDQVICPSQHDGYATNHDIRFIKNIGGATDTITFSPMTLTLQNDITPETYLNFQCTALQVGETTKCIQYPISLHVDTLQNVAATLVIHAQNVSGSPNNFLNLQIYQFLGTGALSQPAPILIQTIVLNNTFKKFVIPFTFPSAAGLSLGAGGDDALFLRVQYPLAAICNINHTKPQIYLSTTVPDNNFDTYDQIETIINSPRTGDFRTSLNSFAPFGGIIANNGSIGSPSSGATRANIDTWPLYNLIWNSILQNWAPVAGGRGASAYADFSANKVMFITQTLGRVLVSADATLMTPLVFTTNYGSSIENLIVTSTATIDTGAPVQFTNTGGSLPSNLSANTVYFAINKSSTTIQIATTIENAMLGTSIDIGSNQTGTSMIQTALGATMGQSTHTLTIAEMPSHQHTVTGGGDVGTSTPKFDAASSDLSELTSATGGGGAHNNIQPEFFANVFIKL